MLFHQSSCLPTIAVCNVIGIGSLCGKFFFALLAFGIEPVRDILPISSLVSIISMSLETNRPLSGVTGILTKSATATETSGVKL